ncbi:MAG TPA: molybdate ABC transporter substrate-binding protein [Ramlibacter sp.]
MLVAVAANFAGPMQKIAAAFEADTKDTVKVVVGSTGAFYTQIKTGAPFDVFLSADADTPAQLESDGFTVPGRRFTFAYGRLVLWSARPDYIDARGDILLGATFGKIAIADPKLAPYGRAAVETMQRLGVYDTLRPKIVKAGNIGQAYQYVATGNAPLGFVALSQVVVDGKLAEGSAWVVPLSMHTPLRQDAVLLKHGANNAAASRFLEYLKGGKARRIIAAYGYDLSAN